MARTPDLHKRAELARQAYAYLRERPGARVTMAELARALEMKRSTLYWYYPDVASIFAEVLAQLLAEQDAHLAEVISGRDHPLDLIMAYVEGVHGFWAGREEDLVFMLQFWAAGSPERPNETLDQLRAHYEPRRAMARALLEQGVADGLVAPCDVGTLIGLIGALVDGLLIQRLMERPLDLTPHHTWIARELLEPLRLPTPTKETP
jgi:AcrR family transcriptional regulator